MVLDRLRPDRLPPPDFARVEPDLARDELDFVRDALDFARVEPDLARVDPDLARDELDFARVEPDLARDELDFARDELDFVRDALDLARVEPDFERPFDELLELLLDERRELDERRDDDPLRRSAAGISSRATAFASCAICFSRNFAIRSSSRRMLRASFAVSLSPTVSASDSMPA